MKVKEGFTLRNVCGENIIVAEGIANIDFGSIISLNESAAYLWEKAKQQDFTTEDLVLWLTEEYDVDEPTARHDAQTLANDWLKAGIIEE